ncbi:family 10 glycosylhydrolase [Paludisphaera rhizosphaerae]|uniref:family 10 glycosylhydrolase n=1 Tax=Paludisphaera rhizosphaerae TaxID=2711216 RepID=UPI0013EAA624|nr:family 10 glycosylhydrolase [Paludisphaera rhizosphaerae]
MTTSRAAWFAILLLASSCLHAEEAAPNKPLRGAYIFLGPLVAGRTENEGRAAIQKALNSARKIGVNTVMPFANTMRGDVFWPSKIATGTIVAGWNPLAVLRDEARRRGMSFEPVVWALASGEDDPTGILVTHGDWALRRPDGGAPLGVLSPANPEARAWLGSLIEELVRDLQPDALWFEHLRYPFQAIDLDPAGQAELAKILEAAPVAERSARALRFREDSLTGLTRELSTKARAARPGIRLGVFSWGPNVVLNPMLAQTWPTWVDEGIIDRVIIAGYCYREEYGDRYLTVFRDRLTEALKINRSLKKPGEISFALGVKTTRGAVRSARDILDYRRVAAEAGVEGYSYFTLNALGRYIDQLAAAKP